MKTWKKIGLVIILFLVIGVAGVVVWQQENLKALLTFLTIDSHSIVQGLEDKNQQHQDALNKDYNVTVQPPSIEQNDGLLDGELDSEDVKESLGLNQNTDKTPEQESDQSEQPATSADRAEAKDLKQEIETLVNQCVAELYACEVDLMAQLGALKKSAVEEWKALPKAQRTRGKKIEIGFSGLEKCYDLEVVIDEQVEDILDKYRTPLEKLGADTSVLNDLWDYYCEKKSLEKAYYMDKYLN